MRVPTPNASMGAPAAETCVDALSSRPPLAKIFTYCSPAASRIRRTSWLRPTRFPLSSRTPARRWPRASISFATTTAFRAAASVS